MIAVTIKLLRTAITPILKNLLNLKPMVSTLFKNLTAHAIASPAFTNFHESLDFQDTLDGLLILDFQDTGILVKNLIESVYTSGITGLENVDEKDGTITGVFLDKISPTQIRKFNFKISPSGITYKEILQTPEYSESDLDYLEFEAQILDFKSLPKAGNKTQADRLGRIKTCDPAKSFVCGKTCKTNGFSCSAKLNPTQQSQYNQVVARSQSMKSEDLNQYLTNTTKSTSTTAKPQNSQPLSDRPSGVDTVKQGLKQVGEGVRTTGKGLKDVMVGVFNRAKAKVGDAIQGVKDKVAQGRQAIASGVAKGRQALASGVSDAADRAASAVKRAATEDVIAGAKEKVKKAKGAIAQGVADAADRTAESLKSGIDKTAVKVKKSVGVIDPTSDEPAPKPTNQPKKRKNMPIKPRRRRTAT